MPRSVLLMDAAGATTSEDIIYIIQGTGNNRDRKVALKDLAQGIIKGSNLPTNSWPVTDVVEHIPGSVQPFGMVDGEAHKILPRNIISKGLQDMVQAEAPNDLESGYIPCYRPASQANPIPYVQKFPMKLLSDAGLKVVRFHSGMLAYTLLPTDRNMLFYIGDSVGANNITIHGPIFTGATFIVVADGGITGSSVPSNTRNYSASVVFDYYTPNKSIRVARNSTAFGVWTGTYFENSIHTPAIDHFVEFSQANSWSSTTTGAFVNLRYAGCPVEVVNNPSEQWVAPIPMVLKSLALNLRFIGTGVPIGGIANVTVSALIMDEQENIIWGPFAFTSAAIGNFGSEPLYSAKVRWEITNTVTLAEGQYLHISRMQYDWVQGGVTLPLVSAKVTAMFGSVDL